MDMSHDGGAAMQSLLEYFYTYPLLSLAETAFTVWMLVDCYRRQADYYWFWAILIFQPVGPWIYFFVVKIKDFHGRGSPVLGWSWWHPRPSLGELRYRAEQTPTLASNLALGERLIEKGEHAEAIPYLEAALAREPDHSQVIYCLAVCRAEGGHPDQAVPFLEKIVARDRSWSDYSAWRLLIRCRAESGDGPGALATCRELVRLSPTLRHRCLLAEHLLEEGLAGEARDVLEESLEDHRFAPGPIRRRNWRWARLARRLQKEADKQ